MEKVEERIRIDYDLIHRIEGKYGSLINCPEDEELLLRLREVMGVTKHLDKYSKDIVEELREERNITGEYLGRCLGYTDGWYNKFMKSDQFYETQVEKIAEYFGVEKSYLMN